MEFVLLAKIPDLSPTSSAGTDLTGKEKTSATSSHGVSCWRLGRPEDGVVRRMAGYLTTMLSFPQRVEAMGLEPTNLLTASQALYQLSYAPGGTHSLPAPLAAVGGLPLGDRRQRLA